MVAVIVEIGLKSLNIGLQVIFAEALLVLSGGLAVTCAGPILGCASDLLDHLVQARNQRVNSLVLLLPVVSGDLLHHAMQRRAFVAFLFERSTDLTQKIHIEHTFAVDEVVELK